jgi:hypothetical protein
MKVKGRSGTNGKFYVSPSELRTVFCEQVLMKKIRQDQRKKEKAEKKKKKKKRKVAKAAKKDETHVKATLNNVPLFDDFESEWEDQDHAAPSNSSFAETSNDTTQYIRKEKERSSPPVQDLGPNSPYPKLLLEPELLNLSYRFEPRVHGSTFILHASYIFTPKPPTKTDFLSLLESFEFRFCPHITSHKNSCGGKMLPDRSFIQTCVGASKTRPSLLSSSIQYSANLNTEEVKSYRQSCGFCWTDYQVSVKSRMLGAPKVSEVCYEFWYGLGRGGDGKWDTFLPKQDDADGTEDCTPLGAEFVKGAIRSMWEDAEIPHQEVKDKREHEP